MIHSRFVPVLGFFVGLCLPLTPLLAEELRIIAVVNDEVITQVELDRALAPIYLQLQTSTKPEELAAKVEEIQGRILQQLIEERLMLQEARKPHLVEVAKGKIGSPQPITVTEAEGEELLTETTSKFESPEAFTEALSDQGLTVEDLKSRYRDQITIRKLVDRQINSRITISPAEVTAYYQNHQKDFFVPQAVQVSVILIRPKESLDLAQANRQAQDLQQQLLQGGNFSDLAQRYSDGPNAKTGGRVGFLEQGKGLKEIDQVLFTLKPGEISPVIKTPIGFYIFRVESIRPGRQATLEEVQTQVRDRLFQEKGSSRYKEWIAKLKEDAYISIAKK